MVKPINVAELFAHPGRGPEARRCTFVNTGGTCGRVTNEGKPFCSDHVDQNDYVKEIMAAIAAREAQDERVRVSGHKAVNLDGATAQEILHYLRTRGARTVKRMTQDLTIDERIVRGYVEAFRRRRLVKTSSTKRGDTLVRVTGSSSDSWISVPA